MSEMETGHGNIESLLQFIQDGDVSAEREFFRHFQVLQKVRQMVYCRLQASREDRDDLIAEVMQAIVIGLREGRFKPERGSVEGYFWGISRNKIRDFLRSKNSHFTSGLATEPVSSSRSDASLEAEQNQRDMQLRLSALNAQHRQVILMKYYEGLPVSIIAERLKLRPKQIYNQITYSLHLLRISA